MDSDYRIVKKISAEGQFSTEELYIYTICPVVYNSDNSVKSILHARPLLTAEVNDLHLYVQLYTEALSKPVLDFYNKQEI